MGLMLWVIFAQDLNPLAGGSGWVGAGLLGLVLAWLLLKQLPDVAKQTRELTEAKDSQIQSLIQSKDKIAQELTDTFAKTHMQAVESFSKSQETAQNTFSQRNDKTLDTFAALIREERKTCQTWHEENRDRLETLLTEVKESRHFALSLAHELGLKKAANKAREQMRDKGEAIPADEDEEIGS